MKRLLLARTAVAASLALTGAVSLSACGSSDSPAAQSMPDPQSVVKTDLGLPTPTGDPDLAGLQEIGPAAGTVGRLKGPFDDRFEAGKVALAKNALRGSIVVTSDVSELLGMQVQAGFYDKTGAFLGSGRWDLETEGHGHEQHHPGEDQHFTVEIPAEIRDQVSSANWGVTVLVNE